MKHRIETFALTTLAFLPTAQGIAQHKQKSDDNKYPNVIYIMADDLGIGDLGCYGQRQIKTPGIDMLAENGMRFTQHYSGSTVSAPSRCSLLTGLHTGNATIRGNKNAMGPDGEQYDWPINIDDVTVADIFKQRDYVTACIGKWGLGGPESVGEPLKHGFDYFFGYLGQLHAHSYFPSFLWEDRTKIELNGKSYSHDMIMDKAIDFINKQMSEPFFLYLTPTIPHAELLLPEGELGEYENKFFETPFIGGHYAAQPKPRATFAAMVSRLDRDVQRIIELLKEKGIYENTIIIFTSDNGTHAEGGHDPYYFNSNGPFRGIKRDLYEGGVRTPFIVQWPAQIASGSVSYHISAFWDFLPTICDLLDIEVPSGIDGISYLSALTGNGEQQQHDYLYWEFHEEGGKRSILKDGWKLIELFVNDHKKRRLELYNIYADPGEIADVSTQYPIIVDRLKRVLDSSRSSNPNWNFKQEE